MKKLLILAILLTGCATLALASTMSGSFSMNDPSVCGAGYSALLDSKGAYILDSEGAYLCLPTE